MIDQILETYRKATESTLKLQQELLQGWTRQWPSASPASVSGSAFSVPGIEAVESARRQWAESIITLLNKHRETLDAEYRAGIQAIENTFRLAEAKDPAQLRKFIDELWRHHFESLKSLTEAQVREAQEVLRKTFEATSASAPK